MAEVTNESFKELISTTKETNKILREDMALEGKPDPVKFIKEEASNLLIADLNRRASKELLKTEQQERESDKKKDETDKQQRGKLIEEQEKVTKAILMMASNQDMQSKIDGMMASSDAEDEADKKNADAKQTTFLGKIAGGISDIRQSTLGQKVESAGRGVFSFLKKFAFGAFLLATIGFLNSPYFDKMIKAFKENILPALATLIDDYIVPFGKFLFGLITGENETIKSIKEFTKGTFLEGATDGLFKVLGGLAAALSVAFLFAPFKTAGLLVGFTWKLGKLFLGLGKIAATLLGFGKATDAAAKGAAAAAKTAGVATGGKPGTFDKKTGKMFGVDGKLTTTAKGSKGAAELSKKIQGRGKLSSITGAVKDKFAHLKKFPGLLKVAKKIPFIGAALSGALLVSTLMDDSKSTKEKVAAVGAVFGGLLGGLGGAKILALAGALGGGPIGALVGGLGGGFAGYFAGDYIGAQLASYLMNGKQPDVSKEQIAARTAMAQAEGAKLDGPEGTFDLSKASKAYTGPKVETAFAKKRRLMMEAKSAPQASGDISADMKPAAKRQEPAATPPIVNAPTNVSSSNTTNVTQQSKALAPKDRVMDQLSMAV